MTTDEYFQAIGNLRWLERIAEEYKQHLRLIEEEKEYYRIYGIVYSARGDETAFKVNPHRPIPAVYIYNGLKEALSELEKEISEKKERLKRIIVELE